MNSANKLKRQNVGDFFAARYGLRATSERHGGRSMPASLLRTVFATSVISLGLCFSIGFYTLWTRPNSVDRVALFATLIMPAFILTCMRSTLLLDYFLVLVVTNRELRRLLDWGEGRYDPTPILSLLPMLVAFLMIFTIIANWHRLSIALRQAAGLLTASMAYALAIGYCALRRIISLLMC